MTKYLLVLLSLLTFCGTAAASTSSELFSPIASSSVALPDSAKIGSRFVKMDPARFERLASGVDFTCTIRDFPLGLHSAADLRVEQFEVVAKDVRGKTAIPAHVFFRGFVEGARNSHVFLALYHDQAFGYIVRDGITYSIGGAGVDEDGSLIVGSSIDNTRMDGFSCGNVASKETLTSRAAGVIESLRSRTLTSPSADSIKLLTVALELDYPFVEARGGNDSTAVAYALSVLAAASDIYTRDAGIALQCTYHTEQTDFDRYTATTACEMLDEVNIDVLTPQPMMWVTMTGRRTDWCGGIADGIDVLCQESPSPHCVCGIQGGVKNWEYPYRTFVWDIMVTAHETGHLVACPHTHNCFWNPPIDSCVEAEGDCYFGTYPSHGTIMSYCHTTTAGAALVFHPLCSALMDEEVGAKFCYTAIYLPKATFAPSRIYQECAGGTYPIIVTPSRGTAPYSIELSPAADSMTSDGSSWKIVLNSTKHQKYYIRLTDDQGFRSYDSVVFEPQDGFRVSALVDTASRGDSAILSCFAPTTMGSVSYKWCRVGNAWTLQTGNRFVVSRSLASSYYCVASTLGGCVSRDTVAITSAAAAVAVVQQTPAIHLQPNPAHGMLRFIAGPPAAECWIVDVLGRRVGSAEMASQQGDATFDTSGLPTGTYYIVYEADGAHGSLKFRKE